jgi:hypothetical protein
MPLLTGAADHLVITRQDGASPPRPRVARSCHQEIRLLPKKELKFETIANRFNILLGNNDILLEY